MHMSEEMWCHEIPLPHYEDINNSIGICDFMKQPETSLSVCHKILVLKCRNTFKDAWGIIKSMSVRENDIKHGWTFIWKPTNNK